MIKALSLLSLIVSCFASRPTRQLMQSPSKSKDGKPIKVTIDSGQKEISADQLKEEKKNGSIERELKFSFGTPPRGMKMISSEKKTRENPNSPEVSELTLTLEILTPTITNGDLNKDGVNLDFSDMVSKNIADKMAAKFEMPYFDLAASYFARPGVFRVSLYGESPKVVEEVEFMTAFTFGKRELLILAGFYETDWEYHFGWLDLTTSKEKFDTPEVSGTKLAEIILKVSTQVIPEEDLKETGVKIREKFNSPINNRANVKESECIAEIFAKKKGWKFTNPFELRDNAVGKNNGKDPVGTQKTGGKKALLSL